LSRAACSGFGAYDLALNEGERRIDADTAAMLISLGPLLIAALAGLLLKEGLPRALIVGCVVAFGGTVIIATTEFRHAASVGWGAALCLVAAAAYAVSVIIQKPVLVRVSALQVTWLACTVGALVCLPFTPALIGELGHARPQAIAWAIYLGAGPTAIAFTTWAYALARTGAARLGTTTYLVPAVAVLLGWIVLGETPPAPALLGGALCLLGVLVAQRSPATHRRPAGAAE
jgi:drug/metabolite transporter (DMT)-like permease